MLRLGEVLEEWFRSRGLEVRWAREKALLLWEECVGPEVARHARPVGWAGDVLLVEVDHSLWAQELSFWREALAQRINTRLGADVVGEVRFRIRPRERAGRRREGGSGSAPEASGPGQDVPLPPGLAAELEKVGDPELRERLHRCLQAAVAAAAAGPRCPRCGAARAAPEGGKRVRSRALCPACRAELAPGGAYHLLATWMAREPWIGASDAERLLPGVGSRLYPQVKAALQESWRKQLERLRRRPGRQQGARRLAMRYVMLVTGLKPGELAPEHARAVLGPLGQELELF